MKRHWVQKVKELAKGKGVRPSDWYRNAIAEALIKTFPDAKVYFGDSLLDAVDGEFSVEEAAMVYPGLAAEVEERKTAFRKVKEVLDVRARPLAHEQYGRLEISEDEPPATPAKVEIPSVPQGVAEVKEKPMSQTPIPHIHPCFLSGEEKHRQCLKCCICGKK